MEENVLWVALSVANFYSVRKGPHPRSQFISKVGTFLRVIDLWGCTCTIVQPAPNAYNTMSGVPPREGAFRAIDLGGVSLRSRAS